MRHQFHAIAALTLLAACNPAPPGTDIHDPYEPVNRAVHAVNKAADTAVIRPASLAVMAAPDFVRDPIVNFADNVGLPNAVVNGLLQGNIGSAAQNTLRFVVNSTVGVMGLFDPADAIGLTEIDTDFGETLAVWGLPEGAYIELPGFGPSNERDAIGRLVDFAIDPLDGIGTQEMLDYGTATRVVEQIADRGELGETLDEILYESADSYAQARLIYLQNRRFELGQSQGGGYGQDDSVYFDIYEDVSE